MPPSPSTQDGDALPQSYTGSGLQALHGTMIHPHVDSTKLSRVVKRGTRTPQHDMLGIVDVACSNPIGIVTYEDVVDTIMQKTSLDEKDFFDRQGRKPPTKRRKSGHEASQLSNDDGFRTNKEVPHYAHNLGALFHAAEQNTHTIRKRNVPPASGRDDGGNDIGVCGLDGADDRAGPERTGGSDMCSSYTENSHGGFHETIDNSRTTRRPRGTPVSPEELSNLVALPPSSEEQLLPSLPVENSNDSVLGETVTSPDHPYPAERLPIPLLLTPFLGQCYQEPRWSLENMANKTHFVQSIDEESRDVVDLRRHLDNEQNPECPLSEHSLPADSPVQDKQSPIYEWKTMPCMKHVTVDSTTTGSLQHSEIPFREESFHDDRFLLPSQGKRLGKNMQHSAGRHISSWF